MVALLVSGVASFVFDQFSKRAVQSRLATRSLDYPLGLRIHFVASSRLIYGTSSARAGFMLLWIAAALSALVLMLFTPSFTSGLSQIALGAAFGGAAGNLADIVRSQRVVDFVDFGWWPAFNFADVAIIVGLPLALIT
jgi:signal peptidase II